MVQLNIFNKPRTSSERILHALKKAGKYGLYNHQIIAVGGTEALRRVRELRSEGYVIDVKRVTRGTFRYTLRPERESNED